MYSVYHHSVLFTVCLPSLRVIYSVYITTLCYLQRVYHHSVLFTVCTVYHHSVLFAVCIPPLSVIYSVYITTQCYLQCVYHHSVLFTVCIPPLSVIYRIVWDYLRRIRGPSIRFPTGPTHTHPLISTRVWVRGGRRGGTVGAGVNLVILYDRGEGRTVSGVCEIHFGGCINIVVEHLLYKYKTNT